MGNLVQLSAHVERSLRQGFTGLQGPSLGGARIHARTPGTQFLAEADGSFWRPAGGSFVALTRIF